MGVNYDDLPEDFRARIEASSLGTPRAKNLRATVSDEKAAELVRRSMDPEEPFVDPKPMTGNYGRHAEDEECEERGCLYRPRTRAEYEADHEANR